MTVSCVLYDTSELCLVLKIQTYPGIFTSCSDIFSHILADLEPSVTLAYSEPFHIQNPGIFRTQDIFRTLPRHILTYSECCVTLAQWKRCHIESFNIFRILAYFGPQAYSKSCLFRHIHAYSDIFNNDSYNNTNFLFFTLILHTFQWNLKRCF